MEDQTTVLTDTLGNKEWRLNNLYHIRDRQGNIIPFRQNKIQRMLTRAKGYFNVIVNTRQTGVMTNEIIENLDRALFTPGVAVHAVSHSLAADVEIAKVVMLAYSLLPHEIRSYIPIVSEAAGVLRFFNGSTYAFGKAKGYTLNALHVHEYGRICESMPGRAEDIRALFNAVKPGGTITIEGTAVSECKAYSEIVEQARAGVNGMKLFFLPWYENEDCVDNNIEHDKYITPECNEYFDRLKSDHGIALTAEQRRYYAYRVRSHGDSMCVEYPSTIEEAWSVKTMCPQE